MRETQFRAKSLKTSELVYGQVLKSDLSTLIVTMVTCSVGDRISAIKYEEVDPDTVEQRLDIMDVKNKAIYENDIVRRCFRDSGQVNSSYFKVVHNGVSFLLEELYRDYWLEPREGGGVILQHGIVDKYKGQRSPLTKSIETHWLEVVETK